MTRTQLLTGVLQDAGEDDFDRSLRPRRFPRHSCRTPRPHFLLRLEELETRQVPSATWLGLLHPQTEQEPNDTLPQAESLGLLAGSARAEVVGTIRSQPAGTADVDFYSFSLDQPARVHAQRVRRLCVSAALHDVGEHVLAVRVDQVQHHDHQRDQEQVPVAKHESEPAEQAGRPLLRDDGQCPRPIGHRAARV